MSSWGAERPSNLVERTGQERPAAHEERVCRAWHVTMCAPGMARYFVGESPMARFRRAEGKEKGKGAVVRRGLKEVQSEAAGR